MKKKIINLTNHDINIVTEKGTAVLRPCGTVPRICQKLTFCGNVDIDGCEVSVNISELSVVADLPKETENVYYIVSFPTALSCPDRHDLLYPNGVIRNEKGETVGCSCLSRLK